MGKVLVTDTYLANTGDAIRAKLGVETTYLPSEFAGAIESITGVELSSADAGKVVVESGGGYVLAAQTSRSISQNGTYDTTTNDEVVVSVPSSGGSSSGYPTFTRYEWEAMTVAEKNQYGLVAVIDSDSGIQRGILVDGSSYLYFGSLAQLVKFRSDATDGNGAGTYTVSLQPSNTYSVYMIAINSEASTKDMDYGVTVNGTNVVMSRLHSIAYSNNSADSDRRNSYLSYGTFSTDSSSSITVGLDNSSSEKNSSYITILVAIFDGVGPNSISVARSTPDNTTTYTLDRDYPLVVYGSTKSSNLGDAVFNYDESGVTGDTYTTNNGSNYFSSFIYCFDWS